MDSKIYIASKAKHRPRWRAAREAGAPLHSRWIDTPDGVETIDLNYRGLWQTCIEDVRACTALVCYAEAGEVLKGALIEVGAALALRKHVFVCGSREAMAENGSWHLYRDVRWFFDAEPEIVFKLLT